MYKWRILNNQISSCHLNTIGRKKSVSVTPPPSCHLNFIGWRGTHSQSSSSTVELYTEVLILQKSHQNSDKKLERAHRSDTKFKNSSIQANQDQHHKIQDRAQNLLNSNTNRDQFFRIFR